MMAYGEDGEKKLHDVGGFLKSASVQITFQLPIALAPGKVSFEREDGKLDPFSFDTYVTVRAPYEHSDQPGDSVDVSTYKIVVPIFDECYERPFQKTLYSVKLYAVESTKRPLAEEKVP